MAAVDFEMNLFIFFESLITVRFKLLLTFFFFLRLDLFLICDAIPALDSWRLNIYSGNNRQHLWSTFYVPGNKLSAVPDFSFNPHITS